MEPARKQLPSLPEPPRLVDELALSSHHQQSRPLARPQPVTGQRERHEQELSLHRFIWRPRNVAVEEPLVLLVRPERPWKERASGRAVQKPPAMWSGRDEHH